MEPSHRSGPLSDYRVLDLAGPPGLHCTKLLADMGADIIKVEPPAGERSRRIPPFKDDMPHPGTSLYHLHFNTNKRSITLDLESADGRAIFLQLAGKADVVIETYSPEQSDRLGLNYAQLSAVNSRLVVASITAFGRSGPWREYKADDITAIALGNLLYIAGEQGKPPIQPAGELAYGMASTYGALGSRLPSITDWRAAAASISTCPCTNAQRTSPATPSPIIAPAERNRRARNETAERRISRSLRRQRRLCAIFHCRPGTMAPPGGMDGATPIDFGPEFEKTTYRRQHPAIVQSAIAEFCRGFTKEKCTRKGKSGASASHRSTRPESSWRARRPRRASSLLK